MEFLAAVRSKRQKETARCAGCAVSFRFLEALHSSGLPLFLNDAFQGKFDHVVEGAFALFGRRTRFVAGDVVADREDAERLHAEFGCDQVERRRFHLGGEHAVAEEFGEVDLVVVEAILRQHVADAHGQMFFARMVYGTLQQREIGERCKVDGRAEDIFRHGRIRRRSLRDDDIADVEILGERTAAADADELLHAVDIDEFMHIDGDGRHAHARALHGNGRALVASRIAERVAHMRVFFSVREKVFGDVLRTQRIAGQQDALGNIADFGGVVWCWHDDSSLELYSQEYYKGL